MCRDLAWQFRTCTREMGTIIKACSSDNLIWSPPEVSSLVVFFLPWGNHTRPCGLVTFCSRVSQQKAAFVRMVFKCQMETRRKFPAEQAAKYRKFCGTFQSALQLLLFSDIPFFQRHNRFSKFFLWLEAQWNSWTSIPCVFEYLMFYDSTKAVLWVIFVVYFSTYQLALSSVAPRQWQPKCLYLEAQYRQERFHKARLASNLSFVPWKDDGNKTYQVLRCISRC